MMKDLKMGIELLKYTFGIKAGVVFGAIFFLCGLIFMLLGQDASIIGAYFIIAVGAWPMQMLYSMTVPSMVRSSAWEKAMQTKVLSWVGVVAYLVPNVVIILFELVTILINSENSKMASVTVLYAGVMTLLLFCYMGAALKFFTASTVAYFILFFVILKNDNILVWLIQYEILFPVAVIVCLGLVLLGGVLHYGISCLLYRKPVSKSAQMRELKKTM